MTASRKREAEAVLSNWNNQLSSVTIIGGSSPHYEVGLINGLSQRGIHVEVIAGSDIGEYAAIKNGNVRFIPHVERQFGKDSFLQKVLSTIVGYLNIIHHTRITPSPIIHVQWPYKTPLIDWVVLNLWYKLLGKRIVFTAHNIDTARRDGRETWLSRLSLWFLYWIVDHIIVHTEQMKAELITVFKLDATKVSVIPHGLMSVVPETSLSRNTARKFLGFNCNEPIVLFFGLIAPYKGLEYLVSAVGELHRRKKLPGLRLLIVGRVKECPDYWNLIERRIRDENIRAAVTTDLRHVPDELVEYYFKAADVLAMPYRSIFQSGVLFLALRFGLPVIASNVGSFHEDIIDGQTGYLSRASDAHDLASTIVKFFSSDLYKNVPEVRDKIRCDAMDKYSWENIALLTERVYRGLVPSMATSQCGR